MSTVLLDQFDTGLPGLVPTSDLPTTVAFKLVITENVANPSTSPTLTDGATVQGVELSVSAGDVLLLIGQDDPAENGFWLVGVGGGERAVGDGYFSGHIGPSGEDGHYRQFKTGAHGGDNAAKTYWLATPVPALFENGLRILEWTTDGPKIGTTQWDTSLPGVRAEADPPFDTTYACKVAVDANVESIVGGPVNLDGLVLVNGDYYLLKAQTSSVQNGVYQCKGAGVPAVKQFPKQSGSFVRARILAGTSRGKQFSSSQDDGVVTSLAPGLHP